MNQLLFTNFLLLINLINHSYMIYKLQSAEKIVRYGQWAGENDG